MAYGRCPPGAIIPLTILTNANGPMTKRISLKLDGTLDKDLSACVMFGGRADRIKVRGVGDLAGIINVLTTEKALALGTLRSDLPDTVSIVTDDDLKNHAAKPDVVTRSNDNLVYAAGKPAFMLFDFDSRGMPDGVRDVLKRLGGVWPALLTILPELANAARVTRASTSAGLSRTDTGEALPGSDGLHNYVVARDGRDIIRFLNTLHDRCWLAGLGWMRPSKSGSLLNRSIVDRIVGGPERLVFEGPPVLEPPLVQDAEARQAIAYDGEMLDTAAICRPLSLLEKARLEELKRLERERIAPEAARVQAAFDAEKMAPLVAGGLSVEAARRVVEKWRNGVLLPDVVLEFDDEALTGKTVGDVLADPEFYEGKTLADPIEGIGYGRCKAKIFRRKDGVPWINSFAHGGVRYELRLNAKAVRKLMEAAAKADVVAVFAKGAAAADLDAFEESELRQLAKKLSGVALPAIDAAVKAARAQAAASAAAARAALNTAQRHDPRPYLPVPFADDPWVPMMDTLNEVIGAVGGYMPRIRDADADLTQVRKLLIPNTHPFTADCANAEGDDDDD
jgi:hypothetical protein